MQKIVLESCLLNPFLHKPGPSGPLDHLAPLGMARRLLDVAAAIGLLPSCTACSCLLTRLIQTILKVSTVAQVFCSAGFTGP